MPVAQSLVLGLEVEMHVTEGERERLGEMVEEGVVEKRGCPLEWGRRLRLAGLEVAVAKAVAVAVGVQCSGSGSGGGCDGGGACGCWR